MNKNREYDIHHVGLAIGLHHFEYQLGDSFFEQFAEAPFNQASLLVNLELDKKKSLFILNFTINGTVNIACDRCGDDFFLNIWDEFEMMAKLVDPEKVEEMKQEDEETAYFSRTDNHINIADLLYEQVILSMPIQVVHPDAKDGKPTCNANALSLLQQLQAPIEPIKQLDQQQNSSLQEQLNKLKLK
jgi:uncharacterized metal-binding protein YceD (DUF177 family)